MVVLFVIVGSLWCLSSFSNHDGASRHSPIMVDWWCYSSFSDRDGVCCHSLIMMVLVVILLCSGRYKSLGSNHDGASPCVVG